MPLLLLGQFVGRSLKWLTPLFQLHPTTATSESLFTPIIAESHRLEGTNPAQSSGLPKPRALPNQSDRARYLVSLYSCCHIRVELLCFVKASIHS